MLKSVLLYKEHLYIRYLRGRIKAGTHGLSAVERAYGRLWSMADRTWQIEHRGEFRLALRRATSLPRGNKRDYVSYKTLVRWRFAYALSGSARGFWFIDPLGLRPRGLCTVATRACHVNHAPPSYNYNMFLTREHIKKLHFPIPFLYPQATYTCRPRPATVAL